MIFSRFQSSPKMYPLFISFLLTGCFLQFSDYLLPNLVANFVNSLGKTVCHVISILTAETASAKQNLEAWGFGVLLNLLS